MHDAALGVSVSRFRLSLLDARPKKRADCLPGGSNEQRPCPWVSCRHHLAIDVRSDGHVYERDGWDEAEFTCTIDAAEETVGMEREQIAKLMGISERREFQIEAQAMRRARPVCGDCGQRMAVCMCDASIGDD